MIELPSHFRMQFGMAGILLSLATAAWAITHLFAQHPVCAGVIIFLGTGILPAAIALWSWELTSEGITIGLYKPIIFGGWITFPCWSLGHKWKNHFVLGPGSEAVRPMILIKSCIRCNWPKSSWNDVIESMVAWPAPRLLQRIGRLFESYI